MMPLEQEQIDFLGQQIDRQYAELLEEVREELAQNGGSEYIELLGQGGANTGEEAVRDLLWGLNATLFDRHIREIRNIEKARMRIREGDYGMCEDCGEDILYERLQGPAARPSLRVLPERARAHPGLPRSFLPVRPARRSPRATAGMAGRAGPRPLLAAVRLAVHTIV